MLKNVLIPFSQGNIQMMPVRYFQRKFPKKDKKIQAVAESLASRGFLRSNKSWEPPANIEESILKICGDNGLKSDSEFETLETKFTVLKQCYEKTGHSVPNSTLHTIECVGDLKDFYKTPVDTTTPFESLKKMDLPKNMYVQQDYVRFHPDKDTLFNGVSAFPKSSTIVTGLKSRKKYEGYTAKRSWP